MAQIDQFIDFSLFANTWEFVLHRRVVSSWYCQLQIVQTELGGRMEKRHLETLSDQEVGQLNNDANLRRHVAYCQQPVNLPLHTGINSCLPCILFGLFSPIYPTCHQTVSFLKVETLSFWFTLCPQLLEQCLVKSKCGEGEEKRRRDRERTKIAFFFLINNDYTYKLDILINFLFGPHFTPGGYITF